MFRRIFIIRITSNKGWILTYLYFTHNFVYSAEIALLEECRHPTVMKDMCAECGTDLRTDENAKLDVAIVPMVHSVPELKVTYLLITYKNKNIPTFIVKHSKKSRINALLCLLTNINEEPRNT